MESLVEDFQDEFVAQDAEVLTHLPAASLEQTLM
jgi:hypothetical protein